MSHVRHNPSHQRKAVLKKKQRKKRSIGFLIIIGLFLSIILSIVLIITSMP